jgi:hypothetical protein
MVTEVAGRVPAKSVKLDSLDQRVFVCVEVELAIELGSSLRPALIIRKELVQAAGQHRLDRMIALDRFAVAAAIHKAG